MRLLVASLVAVASLVSQHVRAAAEPPEDVAAYCRAVFPQMQFQLRCLSQERSAAERVARAGAGDPDAASRCRGSSPSWSAMERCLADAARATTAAGTGGGAVGGAPMTRPSTGGEPTAARPSDGGGPAAPPARVAAPTPTTPGVPAPSPSTVILGPQAAPTPTSERDRTTRTITEADAERQLRGVLEREGTPAARCTKKQYGPGWVTICE
jgi:hypothetical protein